MVRVAKIIRRLRRHFLSLKHHNAFYLKDIIVKPGIPQNIQFQITRRMNENILPNVTGIKTMLCSLYNNYLHKGRKTSVRFTFYSCSNMRLC